MGTLDYGRDKTDVIVREVGNDWWDAARKQTAELFLRGILSAAEKNDVDPGYLRWIVLRHRKAWIKIPGSEMLDAARRLYLEAVNRDRSPSNPSLPEDMEGEKRVKKALWDLVKWSRGPYADKMASSFISLAKPAGEKVKAALWEEYEDRYSTSQARKLILHDLPLRVKDHPHWFRDPVSLQLLLQGVLG